MPGDAETEILVSGINEFAAAMDALKDRARIAARNIVSLGGVVIADEAKSLYRPRPSGSRRVSHITGNVYYDGAPPYQAVPPNPTIRTGNTRNSIRVRKVTAVGLDAWMSETGASTYYEIYPEKGTRYIHEPFPVIKMGLQNAAERVAEIAEDQWAAVMEEA